MKRIIRFTRGYQERWGLIFVEICPSPCREPTKLSPTLFHATGWPVMLLLSANLTLFSLLLTASDRDPSAHAHADVIRLLMLPLILVYLPSNLLQALAFYSYTYYNHIEKFNRNSIHTTLARTAVYILVPIVHYKSSVFQHNRLPHCCHIWLHIIGLYII